MQYSQLPHLDIRGHYQFITFRTHESVDAFLQKLQNQNQSNSKNQLAIDKYLDESPKGGYLKGEVLTLLTQFLKEKDKVLYELVAFSIMPNHVHLLIMPLDKLPIVVQKIKGGSAKIINECMGRKGKFWASDYYDRLIRNEKHFSVVYQYIENNPLKLNEAKASLPRFYGLYGSSASAPQN